MSEFLPPITASPPTKPPSDRTIGSIWRRFVAFAIDTIILGLAVNVVAIPFFQNLSRLGPWGSLVGFCLALPYFSIFDSKIGNGQTLGKRWLHVQVVDKTGATISLGKASARYAIFAIPYFLNEISLPVSRTPSVVSAFLSLIIFGVGGATFYLMLFNRHTRQGLHDLAVGSYVADAGNHGLPKLQPIWKMHWAILGSLLTVIAVSTLVLGDRLSKWGSFPHLFEDARLVEGMRNVQTASVQDLTWTDWGGGNKKKILVIDIRWTGKSGDEEAFANDAARLILGHDEKAQGYDLLRIVVVRGYDMGIAHAQISRSYEHTPAEWSTRLSGRQPTLTNSQPSGNCFTSVPKTAPPRTR